MKQILLVAIVLTAFKINAQTKSSLIVYRGFIDTPTVTKDSGGEIIIEGDSLTAIKDLFKLCEKLLNDNSNKTHDFCKAVDFINDVPEHFTKNKKYKSYLEATKRQGFKPYKRK